MLLGFVIVSGISVNTTVAKKETRFKKVEMDYSVLKNVNIGVIEDSNTGKRYMVVIYESKVTDRNSMQVLEIEE